MTYLRPETAQGMFVNFDNVLQAMRRKLPFGIAQIGKAFRNEITPGNFIFRTREFEQMEIEFFVNPHDRVDGRPADEYWHDRWIEDCHGAGSSATASAPRTSAPRARAGRAGALRQAHGRHQYQFPIGWSELDGHRQPHRLRPQAAREVSAASRSRYFDEERKRARGARTSSSRRPASTERCWPSWLDAYREEEVRGEKRVVLRFHPELAPVKIAVLPLLKKRDGDRGDRARDPRPRCAQALDRRSTTTPAAIGRLYRRQDEVGTPYCVTVDVQTVGRRREGRGGRQTRDDPRARLDGADPGAHRRARAASSRSCWARRPGGTSRRLTRARRAEALTALLLRRHGRRCSGRDWRRDARDSGACRSATRRPGRAAEARNGRRHRRGNRRLRGAGGWRQAGRRARRRIAPRGRSAAADRSRPPAPVPRTNAIGTTRTHSFDGSRSIGNEDDAIRHREVFLGAVAEHPAHVADPDGHRHARAGLVLAEAPRPVVADPDAGRQPRCVADEPRVRVVVGRSGLRRDRASQRLRRLSRCRARPRRAACG